MTREEFYLNTETYILGVLSPKYLNSEVEICDCRNHEGAYKGMILKPRQTGEQLMILPRFNLDEMYNRYGALEPLEGLMRIAEEVEAVLERNWMSDMDVKEIFQETMSYEKVKTKLYISAVPVSGRESMGEALYEMRGDIPVQAKILLRQMDFPDGTYHMAVAVDKKLVEAWGLSFHQVFEDAMNNMEQLMPTEVKDLREELRDLMDEEQFLDLVDAKKIPEMYVLTNRGRNNGAVNLFLPGVMERVAEQIGDSFFILPSSVHEQLLIPLRDINDGDAGEEEIEELENMVRDTNDTQVLPRERLSYRVSFYDKKTGICHAARNALSTAPEHRLVSEEKGKEGPEKEAGISYPTM